jgi:hypothetical protein
MYRDPYIVLGHSRTLRSAIGNLAHFFSPTKSRIYAHLRELIEEMNVEIPTESEQPPEQSTPGQPGMAIVPFMGEGDEIVGSVIGRLLAAEGIETALLSWRTLRAEKVERLKELKAPWILLSAMESNSCMRLLKHTLRSLPSNCLAMLFRSFALRFFNHENLRLNYSFHTCMLRAIRAEEQLKTT